MGTVQLVSSLAAERTIRFQPQVMNQGKKENLLSIFISYIKGTNGAKNFTEATSYLGYWLHLKKLSHVTEHGKNFISILQTPGSVMNFLDKFKDARKDGTIKSSGKAIMAGASVINNTYDGLEFLKEQKLAVFPEGLKHVNSAATLVGASIGTANQLNKLSKLDIFNTKKDPISKKVDGPKINLAMINLAKSVSYVALGALGLATLFGVAVSSWVLVACATSGIFLTILGGFYKKASGL